MKLSQIERFIVLIFGLGLLAYLIITEEHRTGRVDPGLISLLTLLIGTLVGAKVLPRNGDREPPDEVEDESPRKEEHPHRKTEHHEEEEER